MEAYLKISADIDHEQSAEVFAEIHSKGFSGVSSAFFTLEQIKRFAKSLMDYPMQESSMRELVGGFWKEHPIDELEEVHLAIRVYAIGSRGQLGIRVRVAERLGEAQRRESQKIAEVELLTTYSSVGVFAKKLLRLADGKMNEVTIKEEILS